MNPVLDIDRYHPLPRIENLLVKLSGATLFSKIDLTQAYNRIELDDSEKYTVVGESVLVGSVATIASLGKCLTVAGVLCARSTNDLKIAEAFENLRDTFFFYYVLQDLQNSMSLLDFGAHAMTELSYLAH